MLSGVSPPKTSRAPAYASALCSLICFINPSASTVLSPGLINMPMSSIVISASNLGQVTTELKYQGDFHAEGDSILLLKGVPPKMFRFSAPTSLTRVSTIPAQTAGTDGPDKESLLCFF
uniref:Uncharacterized protein n=1 Tax=Opuntia streptacantha TaxID=393608 RepID=A0A7C9DBA8_OPUST